MIDIMDGMRGEMMGDSTVIFHVMLMDSNRGLKTAKEKPPCR